MRKERSRMSKKIDAEYIVTLNPCTCRFDNFKKEYDTSSFTMSEFLDLDKITHFDKLWVFFRSIDVKTIPLVAADFAERALANYEKLYPSDDRVRKAIE